MIIAAAIKFGKLVCFVPQPGRHATVLHDLHRMWRNGELNQDYCCPIETQGFLTDKGEFLDRYEAMAHCLMNGQVLVRRIELLKHSPNNYNGPELFSEDLW